MNYVSDEKIAIAGVGFEGRTTLAQAVRDSESHRINAINSMDECVIPNMEPFWDSCSSWGRGNLRDAFRWGRARREIPCKPSTSKASKEQKRQKKARKAQRKLKRQRG
jgi:hypothetical protein